MLYDKVIFVGNDNTCRSPMAEAIFKHMYKGNILESNIVSRGLVVLFEEPYNPKAREILRKNGIAMGNGLSSQLKKDELIDTALVLTMDFKDKLNIIEDYDFTGEVYTIKEFVGNDDELLDPYGEEMEVYEAFYLDLREAVTAVIDKLKSENN